MGRFAGSYYDSTIEGHPYYKPPRERKRGREWKNCSGIEKVINVLALGALIYFVGDCARDIYLDSRNQQQVSEERVLER